MTMKNVDNNSPVLKSFVKSWMRSHANEYLDECGELNTTRLAEDAAEDFELCGDDLQATIPEWVFETATDVGEIRKQFDVLESLKQRRAQKIEHDPFGRWANQ
jgi:hypothetical protein